MVWILRALSFPHIPFFIAPQTVIQHNPTPPSNIPKHSFIMVWNLSLREKSCCQAGEADAFCIFLWVSCLNELNDLAFNFARKLYNEQAIWDERAKPVIAKFYDDDDWLDREQITKQCFLDSRRLEGLKVDSSGEFEFIFHDTAEALGGHSLVLRGTVQDGFNG